MQAWLWWIAAGGASVAALVAIVLAARSSAKGREQRERARESIPDAEGRLPFRAAQQPRALRPSAAHDPLSDSGSFLSERGSPGAARWSNAEMDWLLTPPAGAEKSNAREVMTPDGPLLLTRPPFKLRRSILSHRERAYARALAVRMPSGYVMCPQVRLDALLTPVSPAGRPIDDWRNWRRRVRLRAVDFVICRVLDWSPVVALEIEAGERVATAQRRDRMIDEALHEAGLPLIRCTGRPDADWAMIEPYLTRHVASDANPDPGGSV